MTRLLLRKPKSRELSTALRVLNNNKCSFFVLVLLFISARGFNHFLFQPNHLDSISRNNSYSFLGMARRPCRVSASRSRPCLGPLQGGGSARRTTALPRGESRHRRLDAVSDVRRGLLGPRHGTVTRMGRDPPCLDEGGPQGKAGRRGSGARQRRAVGPGRGRFRPRGAQYHPCRQERRDFVDHQMRPATRIVSAHSRVELSRP